jgi:predicted DNA-binding protein (MmcQ/YjbR family)
MEMTDTVHQAAETLRAFALSLPGAYEDHPWDEIVIKVNKKIFVFFGLATEFEQRLQLGVKLPQTGVYALQMPGVKPAGYNLGKSGWVNVQPPPGAGPPLDLLLEWIEESYRAVAPKRLVAEWDRTRPGRPQEAPDAHADSAGAGKLAGEDV